MWYWRRIIVGGMIAVLAATGVSAQGNLTDPYEILDRHFEANGGIERFKAEQTQYVEASLAVAGLQGTLKAWTQKPDRSRAEIDLGIFKMTQGDNGEFQWMLDSNGKLQKITNLDDAAIKRREVSRRMADFEYADPNSDIFTVTFDGINEVEGKNCYTIVVKNNINIDVHTSYIDVENFLLEKTISIAAEQSNDSYYGDYREVNGLMVAFWTKEIMHATGQEQEMTISEYVSNPEIDPTLFEPPEELGKDYKFTSGNSAENIPFKFIGNHIYIPVTIGCKERLWVLDTGAGMSVLDQEFADILGLDLQGNIKGRGAGGTVDVKLATLPPFSVQGIEFNEQAAAVIDMTALIRLLGVDIAGILGYDFLSRFVTKVDYANELLSFYDPDTFEYTGDGHDLDVHIKNSVFMVKATLDNEYSGTWLFDLGAGSTSLNGVYALLNGFIERKGVEGLGHGAGNAFSTKGIKCQSMELAGFTVDDPYISFPTGATDTVFTADDIGGLGNTLFRNFDLYVDYAGERVILEKGDNFNQEFPEDHSGLKLTRNEKDELKVLFVSPETPAAKSGFQEGDIVRSINGIDVVHYKGLIAIRKMLKEDPGTKYTFVVERDGREKKLDIKLAELF